MQLMTLKSKLVRRWTVRVVLVGLVLGVCALLAASPLNGRTEHTSHGENVTLNEDGRCWIFCHMNKSAGSTIKWIMSHRWDDTQCKTYSGSAWQKGGSYARQMLAEDFSAIVGGYAEGLRPYGGQRCSWFTMFRHPVPRLVSAFFYCKQRPDQLCGIRILGDSSYDLPTFAEHWGNYAVRQYVLSMVSPEEIVRWARDEGLERAPSWYMVKAYLRERYNGTRTGADAALHDMMQPVKDIISNYTAVGILEELQASFELYNRALAIPRLDWLYYTEKKHALHRNGGPKSEISTSKADLLANAWEDERVLNAISLDIELYEHAVTVHHQQRKEHGVK